MNLPKPKPQPDSPAPRIVCAANRHNQSLIIACGARHFDSIMRNVMKHNGDFPYWNDCEQGFIDQYGNFYTREEAYVVAKENGQIVRRVGGDNGELFSENLY